MMKKLGILAAGLLVVASTAGCELLNMDKVKGAADGPVTKSDVLSLQNPLSLATSTGGTVAMTNGIITIVDGAGSTVEFTPTAPVTVKVNGVTAAATPLNLSGNTWCVSAPNPSTPGTFVKVSLGVVMVENAPAGC